MTATEVLRRMLDDRGVEWWQSANTLGCIFTRWYSPIFGDEVVVMENGKEGLVLFDHFVTPEQAIEATLGPQITGDTSDGYHTFNELYHHRAVLFSVIVRDHAALAWKSKMHHDGTMYDDMFIVGIETPQGQATYHYDIEPYWEMFDCKELERAPEWDGHTPDEAIERIATLGRDTDATVMRQDDAGMIEKAAERIEVLSGFAREYLHRYGMLMSMAGEDVTDEVLTMESVINEVCGRKVVDE